MCNGRVCRLVLAVILFCAVSSANSQELDTFHTKDVAALVNFSSVDVLSSQTFDRKISVSKHTLRCRLHPIGDGFYQANAVLTKDAEPASLFSIGSVHLRVSDADNPPVSATEVCQIVEDALSEAQRNGNVLITSVTSTLMMNYFRSGNVCSRSLIEFVSIPLGDGRVVLKSNLKGKMIAPTALSECAGS